MSYAHPTRKSVSNSCHTSHHPSESTGSRNPVDDVVDSALAVELHLDFENEAQEIGQSFLPTLFDLMNQELYR